MVDIERVPDNAFGYVPTPALVGPIEFTMRRDDYRALGGYADAIRPLDEVVRIAKARQTGWRTDNPWPLEPCRPEGRGGNGDGD